MKWRSDPDYDGPVGDFDSQYSPQAWDRIVGDERCGAYVLHMLDDSGKKAFMAYVIKRDPADDSKSGEFGTLHLNDNQISYAAAQTEAQRLYDIHCKK